MSKSNWEFVPNHEGIHEIEEEATEAMRDQAQTAIDRTTQHVRELTLEECTEELSASFTDAGFQLSPDTVSAIAENVHKGVPVTTKVKGHLQISFEVPDPDDQESTLNT